MKLVWNIGQGDIRKITSFLDSQADNPFVRLRKKRNLKKNKAAVSKDEFWTAMVSCLVTTQQRSGPGSRVTVFLNSHPFPLGYHNCISHKGVRQFAEKAIQQSGLRRARTIAGEVETNLALLENSFWKHVFRTIRPLYSPHSVDQERIAADFIKDSFQGFGPKQSRNLLQSLGLTLYEIPIDSRITKWLNEFGFPVKLSATALADKHYYDFVSEGIQQLCAHCDVYPCVLDAAIFAGFDGDAWTDRNVVW